MRWSDVVTLISETYPEGDRTNANAFPIRPTETRRVIYANKKSVSGNEYYRSYEAGIKADLLFDIRYADYSGEELLEHDGHVYRIYKTFVSKDGEVIELKVTDLSEKRAGSGLPKD